jgi:hypothetical protein
VNQLINTGGMVHSIFRLSKRCWFNRGDQKSGWSGDRLITMARDRFATYHTRPGVTALFLIVMIVSGLVDVPGVRLFCFLRDDA